jgi:galactose-1-phosphate uridylyltransferase
MKLVGFAGLASALALSGCASTAEVLSDQPTAVFHTQQSAKEVAFCLSNKNSTPAMERDDGSRVVLIKNGYNAVSLAFTIWPEGTGARIEYRKKFGTVGGAWKRCVGLKPPK